MTHHATPHDAAADAAAAARRARDDAPGSDAARHAAAAAVRAYAYTSRGWDDAARVATDRAWVHAGIAAAIARTAAYGIVGR